MSSAAGLDVLLDQLDSDSYRRGRQFELIVQWYLIHAPEYRSRLRHVWLWDEWPDRPSQDLGIDLVAEEHGEGLWAIQAKAYSPDYSVTKHDIDSFLSASASRRFSYRLLVATTDGIGANARKTIEHQAIPVGMLLRSDLAAAQLTWPNSPDRLVAAKPAKKKLRADQRNAVRDVVVGFEASDRGQMIRACGTGKTIAALGVHEQLNATRTLVLVPSLSLLSQTLREWTANAHAPFEYLAVCSDETVADPDAPVATTHDLAVPVTTNVNEIAAFLRRRGPRVIFSTYQSSPQIAAVYRKQRQKPPRFDLAICDEAHRCTGPVSSAFATIIDTKKIRATLRLFMTATPRYFTGRVIREAQEADFEIASMDDEAAFGPVFHRLTFADAIEQDLLSDYQVVIVGVDDATYKAWAEDGRYVTRDGTTITDARTLAGQIGLAKAIRKFDLHRIITFHGRVAAARHFASELPDVIAWMPPTQRPAGTLQADYVSGEMPTGERRRRLGRLAEPPARGCALLANARCLAEGVDVPTLDGVSFIDPRRSEIDIVQAVGRAIRKAPDKKTGTIVLPVFIDTDGDADDVLDQSAFKPVWDVLKALRSHDEELGRQLDALRRARGRTKVSGTLPGKIVIDLPTAVGTEFTERFTARIVEATTASWEYLFGLLEAFTAREGHAQVPGGHIENDTQLGTWVTTQRHAYNKKRLSASRIARLEALPGWIWDAIGDKWEVSFTILAAFVAREGHARVPIRKGRGAKRTRLENFVNNQRDLYKRGRLSVLRIARLEALPGWTWDPIADQWEENFALLEAFAAREGHARVPSDHVENGARLGTWVSVQRRSYNKERLSVLQIARLEALPGWTWDPIADQWEENFALLEAFAAREGHARVPSDHVENGARLGKFVNTQRVSYKEGLLSSWRVSRLEAVPGWSWNTRSDQWEDGFAELEAFVAREGHARVPRGYIQHSTQLGAWVKIQRTDYKAGRLLALRLARLEALPGWSWDANADKWDDNFAALEVFVARTGHARVPVDHIEDGTPLGVWVHSRRVFYKKGQLAASQAGRLEALPGWTWDPKADQWEQNFAVLGGFVTREGHARVPGSHIENGARLGTWVIAQRHAYNKKRLSASRIARLEALPGWTWDPIADQWDDNFALLEAFVARGGHARVPIGHATNRTGLATFVNNQRKLYKAGSLSVARIARLEALPGWTWSPK